MSAAAARTAPPFGAVDRLLHSRPDAWTFAAIGVTAAALLLRVWNLPSLGYQHWDEAFYALHASQIATLGDGWYRIGWFAPPGYTVAAAIAFFIFGSHAWVAIGVSALCGTATTAVCFVMGRELFSSRVGLVAALFCGASEFAVMYSRMALADAMFTLLFVVSIYLVWRALELPTHGRWIVAGVVVGVALNTKFDGAYLVLVGPAYACARFLNGLLAGRFHGAKFLLATFWRQGLVCLFIGAIALAVFVPFMFYVGRVAGFVAFYQQFVGLSAAGTPAPRGSLLVIERYFSAFGAAPLLAAALGGAAFGLVRRRPGDLLLVVTLVSFTVMLFLYASFPRLALPLIPICALLAASFVDAIAAASARLQPRLGEVTGVLLCVVIVLTELATTLPILGEQTTGYRQAGAFIDARSSGALIYTRLQPNILLYTQHGIELIPNDATARAINESQVPVYFVTDQTWDFQPAVAAFFETNQKRLEVVAHIPNPMYPEVLLQPATLARLDSLANPPDDYRYITVYRLTGPATIPASWYSTS